MREREKLFYIKYSCICKYRFVVLLTGYIGDRIGRRKMIRILTIMLFIIPFFIQILLQTIQMDINIK